jgi:hypothetical protein
VNKDWLDITLLEDYLEGKLDPRTMNRVEREALEDPFVAEALAGLSTSPKRSLESISLLQKQLQERIAEQRYIKKTAVITWQRLSIAATAAVLFVSVGIIFWMKQSNYQDTLARQARQPKEVEVTIASKEFKDSLIKAQAQVAAVRASKAKASETETSNAETWRAKAVERAITLAKSEAYASNKKRKAEPVITTAEPASAAAAASEPASALNEVTVTATSQARQKSVAFTSTDLRAVAGTKTVSGKVVDVQSGEPLPNAVIYASMPLKVVGTSDQNGNYTINVPENITELTFAYIGYQTKKTSITGQNVNVTLNETQTAMNEVVIRGYQKRSREQTTGSSFVVTGKEVKDVPVANVEQLLQGKVAGLNIQNNTGEPSAGNNSAEPSSGWNKFRSYLIETNRFRDKAIAGQTAEYKFNIRNGKPVKITVVKGVTKDYDKEAIRLIKNGPGWKLSDPAHPEVNVVLKF